MFKNYLSSDSKFILYFCFGITFDWWTRFGPAYKCEMNQRLWFWQRKSQSRVAFWRELTKYMSRSFSISSQNAVLNIVQCENITRNNIRRVPKESQTIHKVRRDASSHLNQFRLTFDPYWVSCKEVRVSKRFKIVGGTYSIVSPFYIFLRCVRL